MARFWKIQNHDYYYFFIAVLVVVPLEVLRRYQGIDLYFAGVSACALATGAVSTWAVAMGHVDVTAIVILTVLTSRLQGFIGGMRQTQRRCADHGHGLLLMGTRFPTGMLFDMFWPNVNVESEVWNIPKYLVALGMILTLLESQIERSNYLRLSR